MSYALAWNHPLELSPTASRRVSPPLKPNIVRTSPSVKTIPGKTVCSFLQVALRGVMEALCATSDEATGEEEAVLPWGTLVVPLLRHQSRALAWMRKREDMQESHGGLLADDQVRLRRRLGWKITTKWMPATQFNGDDDNEQVKRTQTVNIDNLCKPHCVPLAEKHLWL